LSGNQGNKWRIAQVPLPRGPDKTFSVLFEGVRGNGFLGDIAIDDIDIKDTACNVPGKLQTVFHQLKYVYIHLPVMF